MEIKEFIKEVIGDITDAVIETNSEKCNSGVVVCPSRFSNRGEIYSLIENKNIRNMLQLLRIPYIKPLVREV